MAVGSEVLLKVEPGGGGKEKNKQRLPEAKKRPLQQGVTWVRCGVRGSRPGEGKMAMGAVGEEEAAAPSNDERRRGRGRGGESGEEERPTVTRQKEDAGTRREGNGVRGTEKGITWGGGEFSSGEGNQGGGFLTGNKRSRVSRSGHAFLVRVARWKRVATEVFEPVAVSRPRDHKKSAHVV